MITSEVNRRSDSIENPALTIIRVVEAFKLLVRWQDIACRAGGKRRVRRVLDGFRSRFRIAQTNEGDEVDFNEIHIVINMRPSWDSGV